MESLNQCQADNAFGEFTDTRDGQKYRTVKIGSQVWMAENFNYKPESGHAYSYGGDESLHDKYGRLYDWEAARAVSPAGWHLPSLDEWVDLLIAVSGKSLWGPIVPVKPPSYDSLYNTDSTPPYLRIPQRSAWYGNDAAGGMLKATSGWNDFEGKNGNGSDDYGFSALPGGYFVPGKGLYGVGECGRWWTATEHSAGINKSLNMYHLNDYARGCLCLWNRGFSVRCVKDAEPVEPVL
ncbi:MAG: hypothetical protein LBB74_03600 [Chitinispirillales bacterium]|jgi:hypothetical protein|nr:hypothetical protein [Chitinispirillales bacterium]